MERSSVQMSFICSRLQQRGRRYYTGQTLTNKQTNKNLISCIHPLVTYTTQTIKYTMITVHSYNLPQGIAGVSNCSNLHRKAKFVKL